MADSGTEANTATAEAPSTGPPHGALTLIALILGAAIANLNLAVANVALPSIGKAFDASQTGLNLVAVGYSLGLASSVLYLGALGDRYGRKMLLVAGALISIPACLLAAWAPSMPVLVAARIIGGVGAGMAYPTTLALITALWSGQARTRSIALWSGVGGAISAVSALVAGALLSRYWWGSVFIVTMPLALVAVVLALVYVPSHVNESSEPVDNLGGLLSIVMIGSLVVAINFAPSPGEGTTTLALSALAVVTGVGFFVRQRRARNPLYDLDVARRRVFWVAACAGIIVFGSLMAAMFVGQQFQQNVLGDTTFESGLSILPAAVFMVIIAPVSARFVASYGSRVTLLIGYVFCLLSFLTMLVLWKETTPAWEVGLGYAFVGIGVGFAGTPASHSLTGSVPVRRVGMASGTADLQRDLGGAIMQSILGALLTAGYAAGVASAIADATPAGSAQITSTVQAELQKSYASAAEVAQQYPAYADQIIAGAKSSFLSGANWAYTAGALAVLAGAALVLFFFPDHEGEVEALTSYHRQDATTEGTGPT